MDIFNCKEKLQNMLMPSRYTHSLGVADTAQRLAEKYGYDPQKAYWVGLLHDCAKNMQKSQQIQICKDNGIELDEIELFANGLIHAKTGIAVAKNEFGMHDEELLKAISYHATGRENMTLIEKIINVADMIEPSRVFANLEHIRKTAFVDLDLALLMQMDLTIKFILAKNSIMHPATILARNYLLRTKLDKYQNR